MQIKNLKFWIFIFIFTYPLSPITYHLYVYAQDNQKLVGLTKQLIEAKSDEEIGPLFRELKELFFQDNKYTELTDFLKSLSQKKKALEPFTSYYIALSRYRQLKYLEDTQSWDEYFSSGNIYREEITREAAKAIDLTKPQNSLHLYSRLILWQLHRSQQDALSDSALADLMSAALEYAKDAQDLAVIKEAAEQLSSFNEKTKSKELYRIYTDKLVSAKSEAEDLRTTALGFYKEGNLELSKSIYAAYIERILAVYPKEKSIPILIDIAKDFAYPECGYLHSAASQSASDSVVSGAMRDKEETKNDAAYAETIFKKAEELGGKEAFDEKLIYLRGFNLEKAKKFSAAGDIYLDLLKRYPDSAFSDELQFKIGVIHTYILRDIETAKSYFNALGKKEILSPYVISSLYQLGLLAQWQEDLVKAGEYYNKLLEKAGEDFKDNVIQAKARLKEIDELRPIEYNLKTFLDISLKEENKTFAMTKAELKASCYKANKSDTVEISSLAYPAESGCLQVELQYLWSGDIGTIQPVNKQSSFSTQYSGAGTKIINLIIVSPAGILDRAMDIVDVY